MARATEGEGARPQPARDCPLCPRLVAFRAEARARHPDWWNAPVPSFGDPAARLLVVGLAPGFAGANRTGRPFTGDAAGELLYPTLLRYSFARGRYEARPDDGLQLVDCRITNAVRCVPPQNRPTAAEIATCRRFLEPELTAPPRPQVVLALGRIAHDSVLRVLGLTPRHYPFRHGATYDLPAGLRLVASYHCSRYNLNTGRLTPAMFRAVIDAIRTFLDQAAHDRRPRTPAADRVTAAR